MLIMLERALQLGTEVYTRKSSHVLDLLSTAPDGFS